MEPFLSAFYMLLTSSGQEFSYVDIRSIHADLYLGIEYRFFVDCMCKMRSEYCSNYFDRLESKKENK